jgi:hypothetical protein
MAIGITYLERWPGVPRNTFTLVVVAPLDAHPEYMIEAIAAI